jgi:hypothetical protein
MDNSQIKINLGGGHQKDSEPGHFLGAQDEEEEDKEEVKMNADGINEGKWTDEEHNKFINGLKLFGKNWNMIRQHVGTRTCP